MIKFILLFTVSTLVTLPISVIAKMPAVFGYGLYHSGLKYTGALIGVLGCIPLLLWCWVWGANCAYVTYIAVERGTSHAWAYYLIGFLYSSHYPPSFLPPIAFLITIFWPDPKHLPLILF